MSEGFVNKLSGSPQTWFTIFFDFDGFLGKTSSHKFQKLVESVERLLSLGGE
jgi:hypothetical protein